MSTDMRQVAHLIECTAIKAGIVGAEVVGQGRARAGDGQVFQGHDHHCVAHRAVPTLPQIYDTWGVGRTQYNLGLNNKLP